MGKQKLVISCFYNAIPPNPENIPVGFNWANILSTTFKKKYKVTILLHGDNITYGLTNEVYQNSFGTPNPYSAYLEQLHKQCVRVKICQLCLSNSGFNDCQLMPFVKPVKFSIDYIAEQSKKGKTIIWDAQLDTGGYGLVK